MRTTTADALQEAALNLVRAAEKFDPAKGYRFSTYASFWVRRGFSEFERRCRRVICFPAQKAAVAIKALRLSQQHLATKGEEPTLEWRAAQLTLEQKPISAERLATFIREWEATRTGSLDAMVNEGDEHSGGTRLDRASLRQAAELEQQEPDDPQHSVLPEWPQHVLSPRWRSMTFDAMEITQRVAISALVVRGALMDLAGDRTVLTSRGAPSSALVLPDALKRPAEFPLTEGPWQPLPPQGAADPPDLQAPKGQSEKPELQVTPVELLQACSGSQRFKAQSRAAAPMVMPTMMLQSRASRVVRRCRNRGSR